MTNNNYHLTSSKFSTNPINEKCFQCFFGNFCCCLILPAGDAYCELSEMCHTTGKRCRRQPAAMPDAEIRLAGARNRSRWLGSAAGLGGCQILGACLYVYLVFAVCLWYKYTNFR